MEYTESLSHKLAAWNERRLLRDIYDIYYYYSILNITPNISVLKKRLKNVVSIGKSKKKEEVSLFDFSRELKDYSNKLKQENLFELSDYLPQSELVGLHMKIKGALGEIVNILLESIS